MTFEEAVNNPDIIRLSKFITEKYRRILDESDIEDCINLGICQALKDFNGTGKITTYICHRIKWNCGKIVHDYKVNEKKRSKLKSIQTRKVNIDNFGKLDNIVYLLDDWEIEFIRQYYMEGYSLSEMGRLQKLSKDTMRRRKNQILEKLRSMIG
jgi:DNA-directed RNA polymerase specialized sigma subunit